ncbi:hypothetical protein L2E82_38370 [Cichorium intybus]|uniref:Uncharacterized protein n=1 Tax=Cichorium intybus TaxID=13427 RepID=A0ACB9AFX1_CICIN|nr:hypothetical protein L2E82_38370 [Cichorium intybus]
MAWMSIRNAIIFKKIVSNHFQPQKHSLSLNIFRAVHHGTKSSRDSKNEPSSSFYGHNLHHLPLFSKIDNQSQPHDYKIDIVDDDTWQASTGFADAMKDATATSQVTNASIAQVVNYTPQNQDNPDFDEIDDLRICGNLFYKLDKSSKEYEEYNFDFHRRKSSKRNRDSKETPSSNSDTKESKKKGNPRNQSLPLDNKFSKFDKLDKVEGSFMGNKQKQRVPTFNQLTAAYHEPFCLDIYISKASVRACIVHRATSNVVVVAHSISKDMKFDLGSTKNVAACVAVGKVLAQRALADDIHNVVYTPRKGEKLEGKLKCVVQSVISNGVWVKVKIKKMKARKPGFQYTDYKC